MVEEIVESLRHADPLFCKLQNHKPDGSVYQLCLCLTPVFNVDGEGQDQVHSGGKRTRVHLCVARQLLRAIDSLNICSKSRPLVAPFLSCFPLLARRLTYDVGKRSFFNNNLAGEYKYQIGCQVDYDPNNPETPMFIMELERVVRNLPQTVTGETPKAMPTRNQVRSVYYSSEYVQSTGLFPK